VSSSATQEKNAEFSNEEIHILRDRRVQVSKLGDRSMKISYWSRGLARKKLRFEYQQRRYSCEKIGRLIAATATERLMYI